MGHHRHEGDSVHGHTVPVVGGDEEVEGGGEDEEGWCACECCAVWEFGERRGDGGNYPRRQWADMTRLKL